MSDYIPTDVLKHIISFCKPEIAIRFVLCSKTTNLAFVAESLVVFAAPRTLHRTSEGEFSEEERALQLVIRYLGSEAGQRRPVALRRLRVADYGYPAPTFTYEDMRDLSPRISRITSLSLVGVMVPFPLSSCSPSNLEELFVQKLRGIVERQRVLEFVSSKSNSFNNLRVLGISSEMDDLLKHLIENPLPQLEKLRWRFQEYVFGVKTLHSLCKAHSPHLKVLEMSIGEANAFPVSVFRESAMAFFDWESGGTPPQSINFEDVEALEQLSLDSFGLPLRSLGGPGGISVWAALASAYARDYEIQNLWRLHAKCHPGRASLEKDLSYLFRNIFRQVDSFFVTKRSVHYCNRLLRQAFNNTKQFGTAASRLRVTVAAAHFAEGLFKCCFRRNPPSPYVQRRIRPAIAMIKQLIDEDKSHFNTIVHHNTIRVVKELLRDTKWFIGTGIDVNKPFPVQYGWKMPLAPLFVHEHQKGLSHLLRLPSFDPICYYYGDTSLLSSYIEDSSHGWHWATVYLRALDSTPRGSDHIRDYLRTMPHGEDSVKNSIMKLMRDVFGDKYDDYVTS